jgi:DNA-binding MarR family transcriptional regulator
VGVDTRSVPARHRKAVALAQALSRAAAWYSASLVAEVRAQGWDGLTASQVLAVPELAAAGAAGIRPAALARRLGVTRQSVQKLIDGLVSNGIVTVHPDEADGRATVAVLTDAGRRLDADLAQAAAKVEKDLVRRIGRDGVGTLAVLLDGGFRVDGGT